MAPVPAGVGSVILPGLALTGAAIWPSRGSRRGWSAACSRCLEHRSHKTPEIAQWLGRHKRFHFHFTPT